MKNISLKIFLLIFSFLLANCSKSTQESPKSDIKDLLQLVFYKDRNSGKLENTATGEISGKNVTVMLPDGIDIKSLTASLTLSPSTQISKTSKGTFANTTSGWEIAADFSSAVSVTLQAENGSEITYTITVTSKPLLSSNALLTLKFLKLHNACLSQDVVAQITDNVITVELPAGSDNRLSPEFTVSEGANLLDASGKPMKSPDYQTFYMGERKSVTNGLSCTVRAQNGSVRNYELRVTWLSGDVQAPVSSWETAHVNRIIFRTGRDEAAGYYRFVWPTTATLEYDASGKVTRIRYYHLFNTNGVSADQFAGFDDYTYNGNSVLVTAYDYDYDVYQKAIFSMNEKGYPTRLLYDYDLNGAKYDANYTYNSDGNLLTATSKGHPWEGPSALSGQPDPRENTFSGEYAYENGNLIRSTTKTSETTYEYDETKQNYEGWSRGFIRIQVNTHANAGWAPNVGKASKNLLKRDIYKNLIDKYTLQTDYTYQFDIQGRVVTVLQTAKLDGKSSGGTMRTEYSYSK